MDSLLTLDQLRRRDAFRAFAAEHVLAQASEWDRAQAVPAAAVAALGREGYLGASLPREWGGQGWDAVTFGSLHEAMGRADSAFTGVLTVQSMVAMALLKWGSAEQRQTWLPRLARGEVIGAFAMTEPGAGSDLPGLKTEFTPRPEGGWTLRGEKRWISCGQFAGVFLVFGHAAGKPIACLVPRESPGFEIEPIRELLGFRAGGLARLRFQDVEVPASALVGKPGFAFSHVAPVGLHFGRLSTTASALGLLRGCFEESRARAAARQVGGKRLAELGMVQSLIARMGTDLEAGELMCWNACRAEDERRPDRFSRAFAAKYFVTTAVVRAAADAVQIHGASGAHESSPVARFYRNAKLMELIEGTTQVHEAVLAQTYIRT